MFTKLCNCGQPIKDTERMCSRCIKNAVWAKDYERSVYLDRYKLIVVTNTNGNDNFEDVPF